MILDWASTTVDHGSLAPIRVLQRIFSDRGIEISEEEARREMGVLKKDHIFVLSLEFLASRLVRELANEWLSASLNEREVMEDSPAN